MIALAEQEGKRVGVGQRVWTMSEKAVARIQIKCSSFFECVVAGSRIVVMAKKGEVRLHIFLAQRAFCLAHGHGGEAIRQGRAKRGDPE